ncbi:hypothetical protein C882_3662 [Caenispirillum salinarum AK4]|uniref:Major facilitator superfamily associated domain-containing protein n=1 Tax=Caenispirillum salinarum AK4 TaxID=1238182 RepID=K9H2K7_9PROT|nr:MFS transporter [Caenispirillum salinarum]EKV31289.1 hypothetical protein C882_3662 [Caenispirillum salinarum AK4]
MTAPPPPPDSNAQSPRLRSRLPVALRLSMLYGALFSVIGFHMPYWPVWLESRGMGPGEIGILLGAMTWAKVLGNPLAGRVVDATGQRRSLMIGLAAVSVVAFLLFVPAEGFWPLLGLSLLTGITLWAIMPLSENLTLLTVYERKGLDYGRIRLWGSLTFIAASMLGGRLLGIFAADAILWAIIGCVVLTLATTLLLPDVRTRAGGDTGPPPPVWPLLRHPAFITFLVSASIIQASHAVYYGFATLHWRGAGLDDGLIGILWAVGVIAEVCLFAFGNRVVAALGPGLLILLGAVGGLARWSVLAVTTDPWVLVPVQTLHALTFAATHLGAMHVIARAVPGVYSGRAQGIYASLGLGVAMAIAMAASGSLYEAFGGRAFLAMTGMAAVGLIAAQMFRARWSGGELELRR